MAYDNLRAKFPDATDAKRVSNQPVQKLATETSQAIREEEANLKTQMTTLTKTHLLLQKNWQTYRQTRDHSKRTPKNRPYLRSQEVGK